MATRKRTNPEPLSLQLAHPRGMTLTTTDEGTAFFEYTEARVFEGEPLDRSGTLATLEIQVIDGSPCVTRFSVTRTDPPFGITATLVDDLPIARMIEFAVETIAEFAATQSEIEQQSTYPDVVTFPVLDDDDYSRARRAATASLRGRPVSDAVLAKVGEIVRAHPHDPRGYIEVEFQVSKRTASRWIGRARDKGFLGPEE